MNAYFFDSVKRRQKKFDWQKGKCHWCKNPMTLEFGPTKENGHPSIPANFATFEHLQRKRDGGAGKPYNVVLACKRCNNGRESGIQTSKPNPENIAAKKIQSRALIEKLQAGTLNAAERAELFTRGLLPNWPMWSKMMAHIPLGNP